MNIPVVTLVCDFGDKFAASQMELVVHSINPDLKFIIGENNVKSFSIVEGAFILCKFYHFAPPESVHIAVIDPGVGSNRRGIVIRTKNHWFVGPDNGVLYQAALQDGIVQSYVIDESKLGSVSNTFHGRDIFAKVAAYILSHKPLTDFAKKIATNSIVSFIFEKNQVVHIDPYGNIKLYAKPNGFQYGDTIKLNHDGRELKIPYCKTFSDVAEGELLFYYGSHQTLELASNLRNAAQDLDLEVGDTLELN